MDWLLALGLGYLLGSVPFGLILTNLFGAGNLREVGSGNIGATNVLRTGNKGLAAATLLLDAAKGLAAVWLSFTLIDVTGGIPLIGAYSGLAALVGHCYPIWLRFKGGKGVATMLGVALAFDWRIGAGSLAVWLAVALLTRISSLSGMAAAVAAPAIAFALYVNETDSLSGFIGQAVFFTFTLVLAAIAAVVLWRHLANIRRLIAGTEPKIGQKSA